MIKAKDQITLFHVVDIDVLHRYYLLRSSTLAKPEKPELFPPPEIWNDVEPSYVDGSTNSLYYVDCTLFSDGTFSYSDVSLSSTYEAAKEAYNKAIEAMDRLTIAEASIVKNSDSIELRVTNEDLLPLEESLGNAESRLTVSESAIQQLLNSISTLITDGNGESMMTQTADGWTFNISDIENTLNSATDELNNMSGELGEVDDTVKKMNELIDDLSKKTAYIIMSTDDDGNPCIELGKSDNDFKVRITNTSVDFMQGTLKVAYVNNQSLFIEKAVINDELRLGSSDAGGFVWRVRSNGNLGLTWVAGPPENEENGGES